MEFQGWIIGQIIIDLFIAALLVWFIRFHLKRKEAGNHSETIFLKSEKILAEMKELSISLDRNLEEKRELSHRTFTRMEDNLRRANESFRQMQEIVKEFGSTMSHITGTLKDARQIRASVDALLEKGLSKEEIAQYLGISVGEIELLAKLQKKAGDSNTRKRV